MENRASQVVSGTDLEDLLNGVKRLATSAGKSLFAPDSISWRINREAGLFLAAGRATLLQLAHPWVAAAIAEHSRTLRDPIGRFHQTFRVMFTVSFGSVKQAAEVSRQLHRRHQGISGTMPESVGCHPQGSRYEANDAAALQWVWATLIDSSVLAYELVLPGLTAEERESYYGESRISAGFFGLASEDLPATWHAFQRYMGTMLQSDVLGVSPAARHIAQQVLTGAGSWLRIPAWYRALTAQLLPPRFRAEFQLAYGEREKRSAERALRWLRRTYGGLPQNVRYVGPYLEAQEKLAGRSYPSPAVRLMNRLWVGQPSLLT